MSEYLVEVYRSRAAVTSVPQREHVPRAADGPGRDGAPVQLLRSIFVPEDETCFYHFEGRSGEAVREAATRLGLQVERVVEAITESGEVR